MTPQMLQHLYTLDKSSLKFLRSLYTFIRLDENGEYSHPLRKPESTQLVNFLDEVRLDHSTICSTLIQPLATLGARRHSS